MKPLVSSAQAFAYAKHAGQQWGSLPYEDHLYRVYSVLSGTNDTLAAAAFLHDVLEDTPTTPDELRALFGDEVTRLVLAVTKPKGVSRRAGAERYYAQILAGGQEAVLLKLADRLVNVRHAWDERASQLFMYRREYPVFREKLRGDTFHVWWALLDREMCWEENLTTGKTSDTLSAEVKDALSSVGTVLS